jgi:hypothetical protein
MIGPIVAVVTSRAEVKGMSDGVPLSGTFRYTRVYQRSPSGAWKITSFEVTPARGDGSGKTHPEAEVLPIAHPGR